MKKLLKNILDNLLSILLILCAISWTFNLTKNYYTNKVTEHPLQESYKNTIKTWIEWNKKYGDWDDVKQRRFDAIESIRIISHEDMRVVGTDSVSGLPIRAVGSTSFKVVDGELLPKDIVLSTMTLYNNSTYRDMVIFHELGHAVLFLDDIYENYDHQVM